MAITSKGYPETIAPGSDFALMAYAFGRQYVAPFVGHCKVEPSSSGTRRVTIAPGYLAGKHIVDYNDAVVNIDLPNASGASQWFCIVLNRWADAGGGLFKSEFGYVAGTSARAIPALTQNPGTFDQQPIALVRISSTATLPQEVIDLRPIAEEPGTYTIYDDLALQVIDRPGVTAYNAKTGITYRRIYNENQAREWQRVWDSPVGPRPMLMIGRNSAFGTDVGSVDIGFYAGEAAATAKHGDADTHMTAALGGTNYASASAGNIAKITAKTAGLYAIGARYSLSSTATVRASLALNVPGLGYARMAPVVNETAVNAAGTWMELSATDTLYMPAGAALQPKWATYGTTRLRYWFMWMTRLGD